MDNRISLRTMGGFFLLGGVVFLTAGNLLQAWDFEIGLILTEYGLILGLSLLIIRVSGARVSEYLLFGEIRRRDLAKTLLVVALSLPVVMTLNLIPVTVLEYLGYQSTSGLPIATDFPTIVLQFIIISVSAGICEEILFRGVILETLRDYFPVRRAIWVSAILFGLFHFNVMNLLGPIYLGVVFGTLAVKTRSLVPAILGHMTNNGLAYVLSVMGAMIDTTEAQTLVDAQSLLQALLGLSVVAVIGLGLVLQVLRSVGTKPMQRETQPHRRNDLLPLWLVGLLYFGYTALILWR